MSRFISLSSTSRIFGMSVSPSLGNPTSDSLAAGWTLCNIGKWDRTGVRDSRRASDTVLLYKNSKTVPVDRLDKIIRGSHVQAHGLIVDDGGPNSPNLRQLGMTLELAYTAPSVPARP